MAAEAEEAERNRGQADLCDSCDSSGSTLKHLKLGTKVGVTFVWIHWVFQAHELSITETR